MALEFVFCFLEFKKGELGSASVTEYCRIVGNRVTFCENRMIEILSLVIRKNIEQQKKLGIANIYNKTNEKSAIENKTTINKNFLILML